MALEQTRQSRRRLKILFSNIFLIKFIETIRRCHAYIFCGTALKPFTIYGIFGKITIASATSVTSKGINRFQFAGTDCRIYPEHKTNQYCKSKSNYYGHRRYCSLGAKPGNQPGASNPE